MLVRFGLHGLSLTVTATNLGQLTAPFAAGWHPYFCFGDEAIDSLELQVPATLLSTPTSRHAIAELFLS